MNTRAIALVLIQILLVFNQLIAQSTGSSEPNLPFLIDKSVLFGKDIVIHDQAIQNQRDVVVCSAFNGWLYAGYTYFNSQNYPAYSILRSVDSGINWTSLIELYEPNPNSEIRSFDILVCGDSISNLKLFLSEVVVLKASTSGIGTGYILRFNGETGAYETELSVFTTTYSVAICGDFMFPAGNANPYSIGCVFSSRDLINGGDSVFFKSSGNGGSSLTNLKSVGGTTGTLGKVAISYGRSQSQNSGRYFVAWEEKADYSSTVGHIYTSHTEPNFNSGFTTPVMIDNIVPEALNNARNPAIACQFNNIDNDSANLTEIVLFEKYVSSTASYDIQGLFNKKPTLSNHYSPFSFSQSSDSKTGSSVNFNPFDSTFMVTYYNSTNNVLPFLHKNFNLHDPNNWQLVTSGYNDSSNILYPKPDVALNIGQKQGIFVWSSEGFSDNGVALFDAPYLVTGILQPIHHENQSYIKTWPNPCKDKLNIGFEITKPTRVTIILYNLVNQPVLMLSDQFFQNGQYGIQYDLSQFAPGNYLLSFQTKTSTTVCKILIVRY